MMESLTAERAYRVNLLENSILAPGARILCREAQWLIKSTNIASDGSRVIEAIGVSEFIQGKVARFIESMEQDIQILRPEDTTLINDDSSSFVNSLLFIEASLRQTAPDDHRLYLGQNAAMDLLPYQLWPAYKALQMPRQRILIADSVGLGKTLECGILVSELIRRGKGRRILVVTTKSMMVQFQKEFWSRFTIPLMRLDSNEIQRIKVQIPGNHNPFHYYDRSIISVDTLKQDREYRSYLENAHWDIIIIDEAHNVARRGKEKSASLRAKLAEKLATRSDTLILLSATPHDGSPESFASLMNMLDPTAIANESDYSQNEIRDLFVRRFKKHVLKDLKQHVPERNVVPVEAQASNGEEMVFEKLNSLAFKRIDSYRQATQLFKTTLLKSLLSSPAACLETVNNRLKNLEKVEGNDETLTHDIEQLNELKQLLLQIISPEYFSKYQAMLKLIREDFQWQGRDAKDRLVIFTGRIETLKFLEKHLSNDLKLKPEAIKILNGNLPDDDQNKIVEEFGQEGSPVRILLATEVASEGLNLHYLSHKLIHFDIPWSLMTLQQRNGRIDRYGQTRQPEIRYMLTRSQVERMDEVERIIKVLLTKDDQAIKNIGDPSVFMGVFDPQAEEAFTSKEIEKGTSAEEFSAQLERNATQSTQDIDLFALYSNPDLLSQEDTSISSPKVEEGSLPRIFPNTFEFACKALQALDSRLPNLNINEQERFIEVGFPAELERRYQRLSKEIRPKADRLLHLTDSSKTVMLSMEEARKEEAKWPEKQFLWDIHPFVEWLSDRCLFRFGQHQAPVIQLPTLNPTESAFIMFGSFPNRRGAPVLSRWLSAIFLGNEFQAIEPFGDTLLRSKLGVQSFPNPGIVSLERLQPLRTPAVEQTHNHLIKERESFDQKLAIERKKHEDRLNNLLGNHLEQLEQSFDQDKSLEIRKQQRLQGKKSKKEQIFKDYREWVELSMTTEPVPYIKLVAVLKGES